MVKYYTQYIVINAVIILLTDYFINKGFGNDLLKYKSISGLI